MIRIIETASRSGRLKRSALVLGGAALFALGATFQDATSRQGAAASAKPADTVAPVHASNERLDAGVDWSRVALAANPVPMSIAAYE